MFEENSNVDALEDLLKASSDEEDADDDVNNGASDDDNADDGDDYNPDYMKKHMKRFMKESSKDDQKELGLLSKAIDTGLKQSASEFSEADAVVIDGTALFKAQAATIAGIAREIQKPKTDDDSTALLKAVAGAVVELNEKVDAFIKAPNLLKAQLNGAGATDQSSKNSKSNFKKETNLLLKAAESGDGAAVTALTMLELAGGDHSRLEPSVSQYIKNLGGAE